MVVFYATPRPLHPWERTVTHWCRRLSGTQGLLWTCASISNTPGFDSRTVQPVASRCTYWVIPAHLRKVYKYTITGGLSQCCRNDSYYPLPPISPDSLIPSTFCIWRYGAQSEYYTIIIFQYVIFSSEYRIFLNLIRTRI
jgi:hypothetical protein